jgi:1-acyl-sn-glycerol-3-phosphate acyltransferase
MSESLLDDIRLVARGWRWTRRPLAVAPEQHGVNTSWARAPLASAMREVALGGALPALLHSSLEVTVAGRENLDRVEAPAVFVANHASHLDGLLVLHALPAAWRKRTVVAAASDYFFETWWRSALSALALNAVPVARHSGDGEQAEIAALLASGWSVLAFPEGTRSRDGSLQRLHHGASRLALLARRPVVPVGICGAFQAMPVGARWPRHTRVNVRFGAPVTPSPAERTLHLTERVGTALRLVLAEEETSWWTALRTTAQPAPASRWRRVWASTEPLPPNRRPPVWG